MIQSDLAQSLFNVWVDAYFI